MITQHLFSWRILTPLTSTLSLCDGICHRILRSACALHCAPLRARRPSVIHFIAHPIGAQLRVRQGGSQRLASSKPRPVFHSCPRCFILCHGWYRDHLVHVGIMFDVAKVQGDAHMGSADAAAVRVV